MTIIIVAAIAMLIVAFLIGFSAGIIAETKDLADDWFDIYRKDGRDD